MDSIACHALAPHVSTMLADQCKMEIPKLLSLGTVPLILPNWVHLGGSLGCHWTREGCDYIKCNAD